MYLKLDHPPVSLDAYRPYMDSDLADELASVAAELRGARVAHLELAVAHQADDGQREL